MTAGVVSRIEDTSYVHGSTHLLAIQIDAAINSGNSGGPVFNDKGELVGMAFQSFSGSDVENVGWVIPSSVIAHFLEDYERNARYTGFPLLGVTWQGLESRALKRHLRMKVWPAVENLPKCPDCLLGPVQDCSTVTTSERLGYRFWQVTQSSSSSISMCPSVWMSGFSIQQTGSCVARIAERPVRL